MESTYFFPASRFYCVPTLNKKILALRIRKTVGRVSLTSVFRVYLLLEKYVPKNANIDSIFTQKSVSKSSSTERESLNREHKKCTFLDFNKAI